MPTYDYECRDCGHSFEIHQAFTDDTLTECPDCSGSLKKLFGNVGIAFKGTGFYKNDSRSKSSSSTTTSKPADAGAATPTSSDSTSAPSSPAKSTPSDKPATSSSSS